MKLRFGLFVVILSPVLAQDAPARLLHEAHSDVAAGRYSSAIEKGREAALLFQKSGDPAGQGQALTETGLARLYSGDYSPALEDFTAALNLARQTHDISAEITRLNNIGTVFYFQGRYADAMDRYRTALRAVEAVPNEPWSASRRQLTIGNIAMLYQTLGKFERALDLYSGLLHAPQELPPQEQAQLLSNVGALRRRLGDPLKALDTYRAAQALYKRAAHRDGEIAVLNNIGIVEAMDLHDFASAIRTFTASLRLAEASGDRPLAVHARLYRGEALYRAGNVAASGSDFDTAWREATALGETEESWKALYGLARVAEVRGDRVGADRLLERAVVLIESLRAGLTGSSLRSDFLADKRDVYDLLIEHSGKAAGVFRLMEQSRARSVQDRIASSGPSDIGEVAKALPADTAVLEYWLGPASAAVLWFTARHSGIVRWQFSNEDRERIAALPAMLADSQRKEWRGAAAGIAHELLAAPPLRDPTIHRLIVIPDGDLGRLPFEVLPIDGSRLLIEQFTVSYSPSARLLAKSEGRRGIRWPWEKTLEAYADPLAGGGAARDDITAQAWTALPDAVREVNGIANLLGGRSARHLGAEARKEFLLRAGAAPVLHFATHAFADLQDPDRSYILLAPPPGSARSDYLFLREVATLPVTGVALVSLPACETGAGKVVRGEGVRSFSSAFLAAGARSVVTSLWSVGDRSTADFMLRFYSALARGQAKTDALRTAKLDFLKDQRFSHPAYWAAFVLNGDGASQLPYVITWSSLAGGAVVLLALVALVRMRARKA